ncbi:hypothetical protein TNCV_4654221 [Trichonephila clavipes]|nr:hypothetical protein TNCV_4654221 [Trichonephila clavipes]
MLQIICVLDHSSVKQHDNRDPSSIHLNVWIKPRPMAPTCLRGRGDVNFQHVNVGPHVACRVLTSTDTEGSRLASKFSKYLTNYKNLALRGSERGSTPPSSHYD